MNYVIDESLHPIVIITVTAPLSLADARSMTDSYEVMFEKPGHIAIAMVSNNEEHGEQAGQKHMNDWIKQYRPLIGERCAGMAIVTQSTRFISVYKLIAGQVIKRIYNCPGKLFTELDEATDWLGVQLAAN